MLKELHFFFFILDHKANGNTTLTQVLKQIYKKHAVKKPKNINHIWSVTYGKYFFIFLVIIWMRRSLESAAIN